MLWLLLIRFASNFNRLIVVSLLLVLVVSYVSSDILVANKTKKERGRCWRLLFKTIFLNDILGVVNCGRGSNNCPQKMSKLFWPFILIGSRTWKGKKSHPSRWISILTPVGQKTVPSKEVPSVFVPTPRFHAKISWVVKLGLGTKQKTAILRGKFSIYFLGCQLC